MTISSADTAELPRVRELVVESSPLTMAPPRSGFAPTESVAPVEAPEVLPGRTELRLERRQARRQRQLWALLGLSILAVTLAVTVGVLDMAR